MLAKWPRLKRLRESATAQDIWAVLQTVFGIALMVTVSNLAVEQVGDWLTDQWKQQHIFKSKRYP